MTQNTSESTQVAAQDSRSIPTWLPTLLALGSLTLLFLWIYLRFAGRLYFVLDDYIESEAALSRSLFAAIRDSFTGAINWSGYRPVSYATRALIVHSLGIERLTGYYLFILLLHFANALLTYHLVWKIARSVLLAYLAAAFFLLLPAHNEAVLYFSASANLIALFFALVTIEFAIVVAPLPVPRTNPRAPRVWAILAAALTYSLAILSYEVTLPLIALIFMGDWWLSAARGRLPFSAFVRRRLWLYVALVAAALVALAMRVTLGGGLLGAPRADYGTSFAPAHLAYGYAMLLSQMALLFNSPWQYLPDFVYTREWMAWTNPRALVSIGMAFVASLLTLWLAWRANPVTAKRRDALFWLAWGALWVLLVGLPFAALDGRNPENRYTYIPSFGAAILVAAFFALLLGWVQRRGWQKIGAPLLMVVASVCLAFYAWVDTSDVAEWERSASHARAFLTGAATQPIGDTTLIAQVGVPGDVGSAYVFSTPESFAAAMRLHGAKAGTKIVAGDLALRALQKEWIGALLLLYDRNSHEVRTSTGANFCAGPEYTQACTYLPLVSPIGPIAGTWYYFQIYDDEAPQSGGLGIILGSRSDGPDLVDCWHFYDAERVTIDPSLFDNAAIEERCQAAFGAMAPFVPQAPP